MIIVLNKLIPDIERAVYPVKYNSTESMVFKFS